MNKEFFIKRLPQIFVGLFLLLTITYLYNANYFSLTLDQYIPRSSLVGYQGDPLLSGDLVAFQYYSALPNLGTVGIRFTTFNKINGDTLKFRIKNSNDKEWFYENSYKVDQFQNNQVFPFGFPLIENSQGVTYLIQVESTMGEKDDAVAISSPLNRSVVGRHVFRKGQLVSDPEVFFSFIKSKLIFLVSDPVFLKKTLSYALPTLYLTGYYIFGFSPGLFSVFIFFSIMTDAIFVREFFSANLICVALCWLVLCHKHKVESMASLQIFMVLFISSLLLFTIGLDTFGDKLSVWAYLLLVSTISLRTIEVFGKKRRLLNYQEYWSLIHLEWRNISRLIYSIVIGEIVFTVERIHTELNTASKATSSNSYPKTKNPSYTYAVAITAYKLFVPVYSRYIYLSRLLSKLVYWTLIFIRIIVKYLPYGTFVFLVWKNISSILGYYHFFQNFYAQNQTKEYWSQVGYSIVLIYVFVFSLFHFVLVNVKTDFWRKTVIGVIILYLSLELGEKTFYKNTPYRDDVIIWGINPNDSLEPWVDVSVQGRNFGNNPFTGNIYVNGLQQRIISWDNKVVVFRTDPYTTRSGPLVVETMTKKRSETVEFRYQGNR